MSVTFSVRCIEDARGEERACVKLANHEMHCKEHQVSPHSNPLFDVLN